MSTPNQKTVFRTIIAGVRKGEKISVSGAMRKAGYSDHTARQPSKVTRSKGWQELTNEYLPNERLLKCVDGLIQGDQWRERATGLDMALKIKGLYKMGDKIANLNVVEISQTESEPLDEETKKELQAFIQWSKERI